MERVWVAWVVTNPPAAGVRLRGDDEEGDDCRSERKSERGAYPCERETGVGDHQSALAEDVV